MTEKTWRDALEELRALDEEHRRVGMTWTQSMIDAYSKKRKDLRAQNKNRILDGASKELLTKVEYFQLTRKRYMDYKQEEINSWNSAKLASEYAVQSVVLDMVAVGVNKLSGDSVSKRVNKLFTEVRDSGDKYKLRAFTDLLSGLKAKVSDSGELEELQKHEEQAKEMLQSIRETPEIVKSRNELLKAFDYFSEGMREFKQISIDAGAGAPDSPFAGGSPGELYNRIEVSRDEDGLPDIKVLDKDRRFL